MGETSHTPLTLDEEQVGQAVVVHVRGSVTISDAETLTAALEALAAKKTPLVVLDLSGMDFICSSGLGAIISGHVKSRHHSGVIKLVNPRPAVRRLLEMTRLTKLFPLYDSVESAMKS